MVSEHWSLRVLARMIGPSGSRCSPATHQLTGVCLDPFMGGGTPLLEASRLDRGVRWQSVALAERSGPARQRRETLEDLDQLRCGLGGAIDHGDSTGSGLCELDGDGAGGASGSEHAAWRPRGSVIVRSDARKPLPSVLSPVRAVPFRLMQLTAPTAAADGVSASSIPATSIFTAWLRARLRSRARADHELRLLTARARHRMKRSVPWRAAAHAASTMAPVGLSATGRPRRA